MSIYRTLSIYTKIITSIFWTETHFVFPNENLFELATWQLVNEYWFSCSLKYFLFIHKKVLNAGIYIQYWPKWWNIHLKASCLVVNFSVRECKLERSVGHLALDGFWWDCTKIPGMEKDSVAIPRDNGICIQSCILSVVDC